MPLFSSWCSRTQSPPPPTYPSVPPITSPFLCSRGVQRYFRPFTFVKWVYLTSTRPAQVMSEFFSYLAKNHVSGRQILGYIILRSQMPSTHLAKFFVLSCSCGYFSTQRSKVWQEFWQNFLWFFHTSLFKQNFKNTLQEHQRIRTNATVSKDSEMGKIRK